MPTTFVAEKRIFAINLGSTSTKVAYYADGEFVTRDTIRHPAEETAQYPTVFDQKDFRQACVTNYMAEHGIDLDSLDAIVSRGGLTEPVVGGVWQINDGMVHQAMSGKYGIHVCSVGTAIAYDLCQGRKAIPLTVDTPSTDEMIPLAYYSGLPEIKRHSAFQALNSRAMARYYAQTIGRRYEDLNLLVVMLGGGITVVAHEHGRMVDGTLDGLEGDGCFSNNRCNGVPVGEFTRLCYSGKYSFKEMMCHINGGAGLMAYLGTTDILAIEKRIDEGDEKAREVLEAMCYQASKDIGGVATVMNGNVDAILFIGGMANSKRITGWIADRVKFIAPVVVMPGEREMDSLCDGAYRALLGQEEIQHFVPTR